MTIEEKLRKTLQTKTGLKEVINAKGGTITDDTPFEEYINQVKNLNVGGGSEITYPPVPNTGFVENIYFNKNLTPDEVDKIIADANIEWVDGVPYAVVASSTTYVIIINVDNKYAIISTTGSNPFFIYASYGFDGTLIDYEGFQGKGWVSVEEGGLPGNILGINDTVVDIADGLSVGLNNDKLSSLISISDFEFKFNTIQYIPIPNEGYVDKVYFNTDLSNEEVETILNSPAIAYFPSEMLGSPIHMYSVICNKDATKGIIVVVFDNDASKIIFINNPIDGQVVTQIAYTTAEGWTIGMEGSNIFPTNIFEFKDEAATEADGVTIGTSNLMLSKLFYINIVDFTSDFTDSVTVTPASEPQILTPEFGKIGFDTVYVEASEAGSAVEITSTEDMDSLLTEENKHKFFLYNGENGQYTNGEYYAVVDDEETVVGDSGGSVNIVKPSITPIPTSGTLTSINFNTDLTPTEVDTILGSANLPVVPIINDVPTYLIMLTEVNGISCYVGIIDYKTYFESMGATLAIPYAYGIGLYVQNGSDTSIIYIYVTPEIAQMMGSDYPNGWASQEMINNINLFFTEDLGGNVPLVQVPAEAGFTVGSHNELIAKVVNCGGSGEVTVLKTLTGDYESVIISVTENSNIDLTTYMDNQEMPTAVKVTVPIPNTLKALLDKTGSAKSLFECYSYGDFDSAEELEEFVPYETTENVTTFDRCFYSQFRLKRQPNLNYSLMTSGEYMFANCTSLKEAVLNYPVLGYADYMFEGCFSLTKVEIIKYPLRTSHMFEGCSSLTTLIVRESSVWHFSEQPEMMFSETPIEAGTGYIYVSDNLVNSYKADSFWSTYASQIKPLSAYVE